MIHGALALCLAAFSAGHSPDPPAPPAAPAAPATPSAGMEIRFVFDAAQATLDALSGARTDFADIAKLMRDDRIDIVLLPGPLVAMLALVFRGARHASNLESLIASHGYLACGAGIFTTFSRGGG